MNKINGAGATSDFRFQDTQTKGTRLPAWYLNMLQDELTTLVNDPTGGALALDPDDHTQVLRAVKAMIARSIAVPQTRRAGIFTSTMLIANYYYVPFSPPFPAGSIVVVSVTDINSSGSARRDNWVQLFSWSETGFQVVVQGARTGGDNTLDGFTWTAEVI